ncbi:MAG: YceI family protein [Flavobacteriales bacterium]
MDYNMRAISSILVLGTVMALFSSCGEKNQQVVDLDACGCANEKIAKAPNAEALKKCDEKRTADAKFEADYQSCLVAARSGMDTSHFSINKMDAAQGLNLPAASDGAYTVSAASSSMKWFGKKVTGQHNGVVNVKSGNVELAGGSIKTGVIVIDMTSIVDSDLSGEGKTELEGHLKSDDFFGSSKFPEATFKFKSATAINKHQFDVVGDLTIKGITKEVKANAIVVPNGDKGLNVSGSISVDRTQYGIKYGSGQFFTDLGDKMIDDVFLVTFDLKATK